MPSKQKKITCINTEFIFSDGSYGYWKPSSEPPRMHHKVFDLWLFVRMPSGGRRETKISINHSPSAKITLEEIIKLKNHL